MEAPPAATPRLEDTVRHIRMVHNMFQVGVNLMPIDFAGAFRLPMTHLRKLEDTRYIQDICEKPSRDESPPRRVGREEGGGGGSPARDLTYKEQDCRVALLWAGAKSALEGEKCFRKH